MGNEAASHEADTTPASRPEETAAPGRPPERITVVYLAGSGRTGSTLIERILETYKGVCSVGEIGVLWHFIYGLQRNLSNIACPCGASIANCEHWNAIMRAARFTEGDLAEMIALQQRLHRTARFFFYFIPLARRCTEPDIKRLAVLEERIYRATVMVTKANIVIDSSNYAVGALVARHMPSVDVYVKHIVRAPEGVTYSWLAPKYHAGVDAPSSRLWPLEAIGRWIRANLSVEMLRLVMPVRRYRYEWFVNDPRHNVAELMADVPGFDPTGGGAFVSDREIRFELGHAILGNPDRFRSGLTVIRKDDRFRSKMPWHHRVLVAVLTFPLKLYYGYGWTSSADDSPLESVSEP